MAILSITKQKKAKLTGLKGITPNPLKRVNVATVVTT
tara:strand:+ start:1127 stop:1237 length:111 start_codon:yes stop_codon:yes gene_type:complete